MVCHPGSTCKWWRSNNSTLTIGNKLDEVVVTGYGSVTKRDAIGAVDVVDSESFDLISAD